MVEVGVDVAESLEFRPRSDCFRPRILDAEDLGRSGSTASVKYSWARAWVEVGRRLGSHIRHQVTKWLSEAGHCGDCRMVSMECGAILGNEKPSFPARRIPSRHSPPPTRAPVLLHQLPGLPMISHTLHTWSTSLPPGKSGLRVATSTAMAPTAQMSTGAEYSPARSRTSGARYHRVETYVVYGSLECVSRARPKSAILTVYEDDVTRDEYRRNEFVDS